MTLTDLQEAEKTIGRSRPSSRREDEKDEKEKQDKEKQQEEKKETETKEDDYRSRYRSFDEVCVCVCVCVCLWWCLSLCWIESHLCMCTCSVHGASSLKRLLRKSLTNIHLQIYEDNLFLSRPLYQKWLLQAKEQRCECHPVYK